MEFWQQLAERNGPWAVFLFIVILFLWKWVLPRMDAADAARKEEIAAARDALKESASSARDARREETQIFADALKRVGDANEAGMTKLADQMEALTNEVRKPRK